DSIAHMPDVCRLVRIDVRMLDDDLTACVWRNRFTAAARRFRRSELCEQRGAIKEDVQKASACNLDARHVRFGFEREFQLFGECARVGLLSRRLLDAFGEFKSDGEG